jgi:predicted RNA-binding protein YlqC (UPF0109 family)
MEFRKYMSLKALALGAVIAAATASSSSFATELSPTEQSYYATLNGIVSQLTGNGDYQIRVNNSDKAVEFQVLYRASDKDKVIGMARNTERSIKNIVNEIAIATQRNEAVRQGREFKFENRKLVLVRFYQMEE